MYRLPPVRFGMAPLFAVLVVHYAGSLDQQLHGGQFFQARHMLPVQRRIGGAKSRHVDPDEHRLAAEEIFRRRPMARFAFSLIEPLPAILRLGVPVSTVSARVGHPAAVNILAH